MLPGPCSSATQVPGSAMLVSMTVRMTHAGPPPAPRTPRPDCNKNNKHNDTINLDLAPHRHTAAHTGYPPCVKIGYVHDSFFDLHSRYRQTRQTRKNTHNSYNHALRQRLAESDRSGDLVRVSRREWRLCVRCSHRVMRGY